MFLDYFSFIPNYSWSILVPIVPFLLWQCTIQAKDGTKFENQKLLFPFAKKY